MSGALRFDVEGRDWPNRHTSRFVREGSIEFHVQQMGQGPTLLLLHGTGASTHSWRDLMPLLAKDFRVVAIDLPGHGFTRGIPRRGLTLNGMAQAIGSLIDRLQIVPAIIVGHSAGMAITLQLALDRDLVIPLVGLNAAIAPFTGLAASIFPTLAKLLVLNPFVPRLFAARARQPGATEQFLAKATGSRIDPIGLAGYETLFGNSRHCAGALEMMASWNLNDLHRRFGDIRSPLLFIHSTGDRAVSAADLDVVRAGFPDSRLDLMQGFGHLAHEEAPQAVAEAITGFFNTAS